MSTGTDQPSAGGNALRNAVGLALFAAVTVGLIALTRVYTAAPIAENQRAFQARTLLEVLPAGVDGASVLADTRPVPAPEDLALAPGADLHLARGSGRVTAIATPVVAPDGYSGAIRLLVGITRDGVLSGVRVLDHRETPGLGDGIERRKSDWITAFDGRSLANTPPEAWAVTKDGGAFDGFTGATITPRAVVRAVHGSLLWYRDHGQAVAGDAGAADGR